MSSTNGNGWKPRKAEKLTCPSGQEVTIRRPGPEFTLRSGRVARTFAMALNESKEEEDGAPKSPEDVFDEMSDEELAALTLFAGELVRAMVISPKLVLNPREGCDEIGPEDVPGPDFWFLFNYGMMNFVGIKVPVGETEVEVSDLETFREEPGVQGDSLDIVHVPVTEPEREAANRGLVDSAGA